MTEKNKTKQVKERLFSESKMKISNEGEPSGEVYFEQVLPGEVFELQGSLYLKVVDSTKAYEQCVISLSNFIRYEWKNHISKVNIIPSELKLFRNG